MAPPANPTKVPARRWPWYIDTSDTDTPEWTRIGGLDSWGHTPNASDADTTTFDDDGHETHFKASRGNTYQLTGKLREDPDSGDRDPGQEAIEALGRQIGPESLARFRRESPAGGIIEFWASAEVTIGGGGTNDATSWSATLKVDGAIQQGGDPMPDLPAAPTSVVGTADDEFSIVTWSDGTGDPHAYEVRALVAGTEVSRIGVNTEGAAYYAPLTNGTTYTFQVRARNAAGWGPWSAPSAPVTPDDA